MAISSFVLILWVNVFLVESVEISDERNLKLLLLRNRRDNPPAMTLEEKIACIDARLMDVLAKKEALLRTTTEASSVNDLTTTEGPVPAANSEDPKDVGSKTDVNIKAEMEYIDSFMHKIEDMLKEQEKEISKVEKDEEKLKEQEKEIAKVEKDEEKILKYLLPDTSPAAASKVEPSGTTLPDQGEKETTLSSQTTPRSEAAPSDATAPGETVVDEISKDETTSKDETATAKVKPGVNGSAKKVPANDETEDEKTPSKPIESGSGRNGGGVLIYEIKARYTEGEKKGEDRSGTKSRSEIKYEKLKKDDDDLTLFEKKALKPNYIY